jgi:ubiquinol-cytochrome c reductase cytochrome c subunit
MQPARRSGAAASRGRSSIVRAYLALLGAATLAVLAIGALTAPVTPATAAEDGGAVRELGASLYLQNCASCHGPQGDGAEAGPSLIGVGAASADFYLRTGRMPLGAPGQQPQRADPVFDEEEIQALVAFVAALGEGPGIPQVGAGGDLHRGWELYTANCAACHAATGVGNAVGGGFAAVGLGNATPTEIGEAMIIGPGVMPRFDWERADQDAIIAYVEYLRSSPSPGGAPIGGFGPVGEGFVAVVIGLTLLLVVARFVGRRSHEGEPGAGPDRGSDEAPAA